MQSKVLYFNPHRGMVARFLPASNIMVDTRRNQAFVQRWIEQEMIDTQAGISPVGIPEIVPKRVDCFVRIKFSYRIGPTLVYQFFEMLAYLVPKKGIFHPTFRFIIIELGWHHVIVTGHYNRHILSEQIE